MRERERERKRRLELIVASSGTGAVRSKLLKHKHTMEHLLIRPNYTCPPPCTVSSTTPTHPPLPTVLVSNGITMDRDDVDADPGSSKS